MAQVMIMAMVCDLPNVFSFAFTPPGAQVFYRELGESYDSAFRDNIVRPGTPHDESGLVTVRVRGDVHVRPEGRLAATAALSTIAEALELDSLEFGEDEHRSDEVIWGILS